MDLSAIISNFYSRAGLVKLVGGQTGSVTFLGTVSPAGGNLKEPVTESTKKAARCFYALSQGRADSCLLYTSGSTSSPAGRCSTLRAAARCSPACLPNWTARS